MGNTSRGYTPQTNQAPRIAPHSIEAEEAVLGSVLINPEVIIGLSEYLKPNDFFELKHTWIWTAMLELLNKGSEIDNLTLANELHGNRNRDNETYLDLIGGPAYLTYLINNTPTFMYAESYGRIVEVASMRRKLMDVAGKIATLAREENADLDEIMGRAESLVLSVRSGSPTSDMRPIGHYINESYQQIKHLYTHPDVIMGLPTGFRDIDNMTGGLQKTDLITLAARPGVGKTSLMLGIVLNAAINHKARIAVYSLEMGGNQLAQRLYSLNTLIDLKRLRLGGLSDTEMERVYEATKRLEHLNIFVSDKPGISINQLRASGRRMARESGVDLVVVDYIGLARGSDPRATDKDRVTEITRNLKEMAIELNVPVLAASQMNRAIEGRSDKKPQLSDLRESGSVEQDSDIVMFMSRPELYDENTKRPNQADVDFAKHRNGPTGSISLYFNKSAAQYTDLAKLDVSLKDY